MCVFVFMSVSCLCNCVVLHIHDCIPVACDILVK